MLECSLTIIQRKEEPFFCKRDFEFIFPMQNIQILFSFEKPVSSDILIVDVDYITEEEIRSKINFCSSCKIILVGQEEKVASMTIYGWFDDIWIKPVRKTEMIKTFLSIRNIVRSTGRICIASQEELEWIAVSDIVRIEADRAYCIVYLQNGEIKTVSQSLKEMERKISILFENKFFFRTHKSHLVNLRLVRKYVKTDGGFIILKDHSRVPVTTTKKAILFGLMNHTSL